MRFLAIALLVVGCGSSSKSKTTPEPTEPAEDPKDKAAREAREKREEEIRAMKPRDPFEVRDKTAFKVNERCGQGPYRLETEALGAKYSEEVRIYACGKHGIKGNYRMTMDTTWKTSSSSEYAFGYGNDGANKACKGTPVAAVTPGTASSGGGGGAKGGNAKTGGPTAAAPSKLQPVTLEKTALSETKCVETYITEHGLTGFGKSKITIDIWSAEPMDLEDLVFVVVRKAVVSTMTDEQWTAYNKQYSAWAKAYRALIDGEVAAGRTSYIDNSVKAPPPPAARAETPPPRPSKNARWIPGYWHYEETKFHWIAGLWDVPPEDIEKELTVQAPKPPPVTPPKAVRDEPVEPQPTRTAVWTPGSWYWDGRVYVWIAGAWRIPPSPQQTWQRPTWRVRTGRAIYVPGGWRIRIGR